MCVIRVIMKLQYISTWRHHDVFGCPKTKRGHILVMLAWKRILYQVSWVEHLKFWQTNEHKNYSFINISIFQLEGEVQRCSLLDVTLLYTSIQWVVYQVHIKSMDFLPLQLIINKSLLIQSINPSLWPGWYMARDSPYSGWNTLYKPGFIDYITPTAPNFILISPARERALWVLPGR